jgi:hypothetical protein
MEEAGREVEDYHGGFLYREPWMRIERDGLKDVIRETTVQLKGDELSIYFK